MWSFQWLAKMKTLARFIQLITFCLICAFCVLFGILNSFHNSLTKLLGTPNELGQHDSDSIMSSL